jgi:Arc/MetJ-type ribon-helix-helix transcriptional regulator
MTGAFSMNDARITIRLDECTERRLREEAVAAGKNESEVVRDALAVYFARTKRRATALEVARRAGIIGCADGLPADLSTNKDHFEGFGR